MCKVEGMQVMHPSQKEHALVYHETFCNRFIKLIANIIGMQQVGRYTHVQLYHSHNPMVAKLSRML